MSLLKYFSYKAKNNPGLSSSLPVVLPTSVPSLSSAELEATNTCVGKVLTATTASRGKYNRYTPEERAAIGKYAAENGPTRVAKYFSGKLKIQISEPTARKFKEEYLKKLQELIAKQPCSSGSSTTCHRVEVKALPTKTQGRPLLLGEELDKCVQDYIKNLREIRGVVNTAIVVGAANGIVSAQNCALLLENGSHVSITKGWAKSILHRMNYVKRKGSNAGKVSISCFSELRDVFLRDIQAEVVMNDIPKDLIFNWDQTAIQLVPTGDWTMNEAKAEKVVIANSDDKRQITAVLAATMTGEYLPTQLIYKGKTTRCHPKVSFPEGWDVWHSDNHWSNEDTMERYILNIIIPYVCHKREVLKLQACHPALAIIDCFKGQTTPRILSLLRENDIIPLIVLANCTDKLQPIDVSINKPIKHQMRTRFQSWYADAVQRQLKEMPIDKVKVDLTAPVVKTNCARWLIAAVQNLQERPVVAINGFK